MCYLKLFIIMCAVALVAAAPPHPNKGKEVKEEKSPSDDEYEYELDEDVPERLPCVARESCADPEEDQPRPGPSQPIKGKQTKGQRVKSSKGNAPSAPIASTSRGTGKEGRKPFPLRWPKDCRGHNCMSKCREPGTQFNRKLF